MSIRRQIVLGVLLATVAATGCGRSEPGTPQPTPPAGTSTASSGPGSGSTPTTPPSAAPTTSTSQPPAVTAGVSVYFLRGEKLIATRRQVQTPAVASAAVSALLQGPTAAEQQAGMSSSVPAGTTLRGVALQGGLATVDLSGTFASGGGTLSMTSRLAQVVFTLTRFATIDRVNFRLDGVPVTVFGGEGIILDHPQTRADYEDLSPAVLIESPTIGTTARSPLRVYGTANTFEAVFQLQLVDPSGRSLTDRRVMATSGTGTRGAFDVTLRFTVPQSGTGKLIAWYSSPKDGSRVVVAEIPVNLTR
ncbi:Sporulation and spore germination [Actinokineospora alba]|uniref:Sporulation and spore germination n=1 Tax=Actinokineospora alba TaxID=504798 RepID=A0A1H0FME3_9PSEU|nr:GerMN domain-containing protein [Actinokineospora alba]TDP69534.1 sporulation and spore germination protein [Actinokineospora alba]SDI14738.1 Sporulation and spore germination [Actinokineospora alba]SDN95722.1 Sporulation and spore germination [Actinokineospora alba]